jgi:HPt (histidine-containing phosphotransfer) domain-containing protein
MLGADGIMDLHAPVEVTTFRPTRSEPCRGPIDHAHLARYTFGNAALEREVLGLFAEQAPTTLAWLKSATTSRTWRDAAHTLKGSARAVGACEVAAAAEAVEGLACATDPDAKLMAVERLERALAIACRYIQDFGAP